MKQGIKHRIYFLFCVMTFMSPSYAWNELGHKVIATIAYTHLNDTARHEVDDLLTYFNQEYPDLHTFPELADWPDMLRSQKIELFTHWHYIDVGFSTDGTPVKNVIDTDNAAWAMTNLPVIVKNTHANAFERARFLGFLAHIVSDLHQPLHAVSYFSSDHPEGDHGGNDYVINFKNGALNSMKLHALWDEGVTLFYPANDNIDVLAEKIMKDYPESYFATRVNDLEPNNWLQEDMALAKKYVYDTPQHETPSQSYLTNGKAIAEQQAALAGYRLAALLNTLFG